ncbi:hypothetical protein SPRG_12550 [Saprolegnia parasitica CBS 223.65]|uniref:Uncharacterized protein n=1 Tax=Saprolegnia parasitica (strain CBS 223.65) TaxID=695850 RepID=A0A067C0D0_SAPPC|nr:hypothetical protein SPRG_12550 [Saprolegnia parasitica CBS 223.65]KDO22570.1 hypothetical protein SPRG_12550 [Saprolegnia parasitica CBS 223.65]|eukprot:XP_012206686.1 hypothetical protein SPRG_12550 [Saprolegnia parasitica CBS 223.65]
MSLRHKLDVYHEVVAPTAPQQQPDGVAVAQIVENRLKAFNVSISAFIYKCHAKGEGTAVVGCRKKVRKSEQTTLSDMKTRLAIVMHVAQMDINVRPQPPSSDRVARRTWKSSIQQLGELMETAFNANMHALDGKNATKKIQGVRKRYSSLMLSNLPAGHKMYLATYNRIQAKKLQDNETPTEVFVLPKFVSAGLAGCDPEL